MTQKKSDSRWLGLSSELEIALSEYKAGNHDGVEKFASLSYDWALHMAKKAFYPDNSDKQELFALKTKKDILKEFDKGIPYLASVQKPLVYVSSVMFNSFNSINQRSDIGNINKKYK